MEGIKYPEWTSRHIEKVRNFPDKHFTVIWIF